MVLSELSDKYSSVCEQKTFDCVNYDILCQTLELIGVDSLWFKSYLSNRSQIAKTKTKTKKLFICPKFVMLYFTHLVCQIERARRQILRQKHLSLLQMPP